MSVLSPKTTTKSEGLHLAPLLTKVHNTRWASLEMGSKFYLIWVCSSDLFTEQTGKLLVWGRALQPVWDAR